jgi:DNA polymerase III sliding clamp (beta) subunit (PCNA family)
MDHLENSTMGECKSFILPRSCIGALPSALPKPKEDDDNFTIKFDGVNARITGKDGIIINTRILDAKFPDYKTVIPGTKGYNYVRISKADLLQPIRQAMTIAEDSSSMKMKFNGGIDVEYNGSGYYQNFSIPIKEKSYNDGVETQIGLNGKYVIDAFQHGEKDEDVLIAFANPESPVTFKYNNDNFMALVMPVKI